MEMTVSYQIKPRDSTINTQVKTAWLIKQKFPKKWGEYLSIGS